MTPMSRSCANRHTLTSISHIYMQFDDPSHRPSHGRAIHLTRPVARIPVPIVAEALEFVIALAALHHSSASSHLLPLLLSPALHTSGFLWHTCSRHVCSQPSWPLVRPFCGSVSVCRRSEIERIAHGSAELVVVFARLAVEGRGDAGGGEVSGGSENAGDEDNDGELHGAVGTWLLGASWYRECPKRSRWGCVSGGRDSQCLSECVS
jgi:hypothetical protein